MSVKLSVFSMSVRLNVWSNVRWPCRVYPLVSHAEYAPLAVLRIEKDGTDGRTDGRQIVTFRLPLNASSVIIYRLHWWRLVYAWRLYELYKKLMSKTSQFKTACKDDSTAATSHN